MSDCAVGWAAKVTMSGQISNAVGTAGHCGDTGNTGNTAYGYNLGGAFNEVCSNADRQIHLTPAPTPWYGLYMHNAWTNIAAVAGGWFNGQSFYRRGRFTQAIGTITDPVLRSVVSGTIGDCGNYNSYQFRLYNTSWGGLSGGAIGGDSGGPLLLAYAGGYYLAGQTSTQAAGGDSGGSAVLSVPSGTMICTAASPC
jgi:hypothetical protein